MDKVKIHFKSVMVHDNNNEEIQYKTDGFLAREKDYQKLIFKEPIETGQDRIKNEIFFNEDEVIITREGNIYHEMHFLKEKKSTGFYEMRSIKLVLDITLLDFLVTGNIIKVTYDLYVDNVENGRFDIEIKYGSEINE